MKTTLESGEETVRAIIREMVTEAFYVSQKYHYPLRMELLRVIQDCRNSGIGLTRLVDMGWPKEIWDVLGDLLEDFRMDLEEELRQKRLLKSRSSRAIDLDDAEVHKGRYFVRPTGRSDFRSGIDLEDTYFTASV
jgi:hypothetical protein